MRHLIRIAMLLLLLVSPVHASPLCTGVTLIPCPPFGFFFCSQANVAGTEQTSLGDAFLATSCETNVRCFSFDFFSPEACAFAQGPNALYDIHGRVQEYCLANQKTVGSLLFCGPISSTTSILGCCGTANFCQTTFLTPGLTLVPGTTNAFWVTGALSPCGFDVLALSATCNKLLTFVFSANGQSVPNQTNRSAIIPLPAFGVNFGAAPEVDPASEGASASVAIFFSLLAVVADQRRCARPRAPGPASSAA